jgi:hypothetical protein
MNDRACLYIYIRNDAGEVFSGWNEEEFAEWSDDRREAKHFYDRVEASKHAAELRKHPQIRGLTIVKVVPSRRDG